MKLRKRGGYFLKKRTCSLLICSLLALGIQQHPVEAHAKSVPVQRNLPPTIQLKFTPANVEHTINKIQVPHAEFPLTSEKALRYLPDAQEILRHEKKTHGNIFLYSKKTDSDIIQAAFEVKGALYTLGDVGGINSLEAASVDLVQGLIPTNIPILRIRGILGANNLQTQYYFLMNGVPKPLLSVEGTVSTLDLDKDGTQEIIASSGLPSVAFIYKYINGRYHVANLNQQLNALSVTPDDHDKKLFEVIPKSGDEPLIYRYGKNMTLEQVRR